MKKTLAILAGLALVASAHTLSAQQGPGRGQGRPETPPCQVGQGGGQNCPGLGQGQGQGMQHRYGQIQGKGKGQGQGKGFRGGPRDGSGPRRDGSCGDCPNQI